MEGRRFNKKLGIKDDKYVHYYHKQVQTFNHLLDKKKKEVTIKSYGALPDRC